MKGISIQIQNQQFDILKLRYFDGIDSETQYRPKRWGGMQEYDEYNLPPLVRIGLTDIPKLGGAHATPAPTSGVPEFVFVLLSTDNLRSCISKTKKHVGPNLQVLIDSDLGHIWGTLPYCGSFSGLSKIFYLNRPQHTVWLLCQSR